MSMTKRWLEDISVDMGCEGEINDEVIAEGKRQLEESDENSSD